MFVRFERFNPELQRVADGWVACFACFWRVCYSFSKNDCQLAALKVQTPTTRTHNSMRLDFRGSTCTGSGALWAECNFGPQKLQI